MKEEVASTAVATITPAKEPVLFAVTKANVQEYVELAKFRVTDINDKAQVKELSARRMRLVKARTGLDAVRKQLNDDHQKAIDENNSKVKEIKALLAPHEKALDDEQERVEKAQADARKKAEDELYVQRKADLDAVGAVLAESDIRQMTESGFKSAMIVATAQHEERKKLKAAQEELDRARKEQEARDKAEADRLAEIARQEQEARDKAEADRRAAEDEQRRKDKEAADLRAAELQAEADKLAAEKAAFEKQQQDARDKAEADRVAEAERVAASLKAMEDQIAADKAAADAELAERQRKLEEREAELQRQEDARQAEKDRQAQEEADRIAEDARLAQEERDWLEAVAAAAKQDTIHIGTVGSVQSRMILEGVGQETDGAIKTVADLSYVPVESESGTWKANCIVVPPRTSDLEWYQQSDPPGDDCGYLEASGGRTQFVYRIEHHDDPGGARWWSLDFAGTSIEGSLFACITAAEKHHAKALDAESRPS